MKSVARRGHKKSVKQNEAILNRRASFDYNLDSKLLVGLSLNGREVKAARLGHVSLKGAYVVPKINQTTKKQELFLINASFTLSNNAPHGSGQAKTTIDTSARKILARRSEINRLCELKASGYTIIPTKLLTSGHYIKLEIAAGKGKKLYDKRQVIKKRDTNREISRINKHYRV